MFAVPILIDRSMTNYSAGVSENGNIIKSKMTAKYRDKQHLSPMTPSRPTLFSLPTTFQYKYLRLGMTLGNSF